MPLTKLNFTGQPTIPSTSLPNGAFKGGQAIGRYEKV